MKKAHIKFNEPVSTEKKFTEWKKNRKTTRNRVSITFCCSGQASPVESLVLFKGEATYSTHTCSWTSF
jgi:hypothetical protein